MKKRLLVILMSLAMIVTMMPVSVYAGVSNLKEKSNDKVMAVKVLLDDIKEDDQIVLVCHGTGFAMGTNNGKNHMSAVNVQEDGQYASWENDESQQQPLRFKVQKTAEWGKVSFAEANDSNSKLYCYSSTGPDPTRDDWLMISPPPTDALTVFGCIEHWGGYQVFEWDSMRPIGLSEGEDNFFSLDNALEHLNMYFYKVLNPEEYSTLSFDMQGHGEQVGQQIVYNGNKAQKPDDPSEEGYTFGGWYDNKECTGMEFNFDTPITSDITLYAKWTVSTHTVKFDANGHGTAPEAQTVDHGEKAQKPDDPSEEGYTFGGWYDNKECTGTEFDFDTLITADTTLYAKWTVSTHTVKFDANGHGTAPEAQTVDYGEKAQKPDDPSEEGYTFGGWYDNKECTGTEFDFDTLITADTTLYAKWTVSTHTVKFDANGHGTAPEAQTVDYGEKAQKPDDPSEEGYTFGGWYDNKECTGMEFNFDTPITSDITLYAKWIINAYTVKYDANGHGTAPEAQTVDYGEKAQKPDDPSEEGYTFGGWYDNKECTGMEFNFDTPITSDITLYAKWNINTYTVTFDVQGHGTVPEAQTVDYGDKAQKPVAPSETGYTFGGWYTEKECENEFDFGTPITTDTTIYAKWNINTYTVTFDVQGHGTVPEAQTVDYGDKAQKPVAPSETGYTFGGWYTEKECENEFDFGTPITTDTTIYAKWNINTYTVTFDVQGHGTVPEAQTVDYGDKAQKPVAPSERGYIFGGWYGNRECTGSQYDFGTPVTADMTLYAHWSSVIVPEIRGFSVKTQDSKTALVKWDKVSGFDGIKYELWRREGTSGKFKIIAQGTSNIYIDTKVKAGTKYYYKVRAIRIAQGYTYKGKFSATDYAYPRLYQVTKLNAIAVNAAKVQLKWNANGNKNVVYQVYRSTKSDTGFKKVGTITDGKTSFSQSFTPEQSGKKYYYKVRAITKDYTGKWHYGTFSKVDYAYPRVHAVAGFKAWAPNAKCAKVYFKALPDQSTKYWLYKSTKPSGDWGSPIAKLGCKDNLYIDKKVKAGRKYYYKLRPVEVINGKTYFGPYTNVEYAWPR